MIGCIARQSNFQRILRWDRLGVERRSCLEGNSIFVKLSRDVYALSFLKILHAVKAKTVSYTVAQI